MKKIAVTLSFCLIIASAVASLGLAADGKALYDAKCAGCHGADGSKAVMGTKPIKGMAEAEAAKALAGYQAKTFGGDKKAIMEGQVKSLSDDDIKALAQHISKL